MRPVKKDGHIISEIFPSGNGGRTNAQNPGKEWKNADGNPKG